MTIEIKKPTRRLEREFLSAARRSRALHGQWASPPRTPLGFDAYLTRLRRPTHVGFWLIERESGNLLGVVNLNEIVRGSFQSAYLGYYLFSPHEGRGYMAEGLRLVERLGFRLEGYSPRYLKSGGRWRDHERWALLVEEWREQKGVGRRERAA